jgi:sensor histidine kinase YesM
LRETEKSRSQTEMISLKLDTDDVKLDDKTIRLIGIPFFGITIPNVTGLFGPLTFNDPVYWLGYIHFILLSYLVWQGNRFLLFRTRKRFTWFDKPIEKLILLIVNNIFYTSPLTISWLCLWYKFAGFNHVNWSVIYVVVLINVICVLFVTHVYETVFMLKEQQGEQLKNAELSKAKAEAELSALKHQIDPHFMFNSLNSLSYLISTDSKKASLFTDNLAEVYRYILSQKDETLVLLEDELEFTHKYTELLHLRFGDAIRFTRQFNIALERNYLIPPTSVFVAFENVVKHNEVNEQNPLTVQIFIEGDELVISNEIRAKRNVGHSSGIGLTNLANRFQLITEKSVTISNADDIFKVKLPLIKLNS